MNTILDYLEGTQRNHPDKVAVDDGSVILEWTQLLELSKRVGTALCKRTNARKPIVILMEKSAITLAAMYGTVYAGCFYVMVDPSQPVERMKNIFSILRPEIVITNEEGKELLADAAYEKKFLNVNELLKEQPEEEVLAEVRKNMKDTDLLYGIFTSGSTGIPKGLVVSQRSVIDFISHFIETFQFDAKDRIGNQAPFDFDVSVKDIYTSAFTGAELVLIPKNYFSVPPVLLDFLCEKKITTLIWAVSALCVVTALKGLQYRIPTEVKRILFSGEVMPIKQLRQWQESLPDTQFVNLYGPSEITCNCTYFRINKVYGENEKIPIGHPFSGRKVFLIDTSGNEILKKEQKGEICVAGESLSEGYYNNPEETAKRFMLYGNDKKERIYKTGDLGYFGSDGELYFAGRKDFQIKHMGHRIELEEIDHKIQQMEDVESSCTLMDEKRNRIVAFYMGERKTAEVRSKLKEVLPVYMVPQKIINVERMPLNKNGKTDRDQLKQRLEV